MASLYRRVGKPRLSKDRKFSPCRPTPIAACLLKQGGVNTPVHANKHTNKSISFGTGQGWPRFFEQLFRADKWRVCQGQAAMRRAAGGSGRERVPPRLERGRRRLEKSKHPIDARASDTLP
jgi:hypothetical protein